MYTFDLPAALLPTKITLLFKQIAQPSHDISILLISTTSSPPHASRPQKASIPPHSPKLHCFSSAPALKSHVNTVCHTQVWSSQASSSDCLTQTLPASEQYATYQALPLGVSTSKCPPPHVINRSTFVCKRKSPSCFHVHGGSATPRLESWKLAQVGEDPHSVS